MQAFPGFQFPAPNLSWLNSSQQGGPPRPSVPTTPNSSQVAGSFNPLNAYNSQMEAWRRGQAGNSQMAQGMALLLGDVANNQASQ